MSTETLYLFPKITPKDVIATYHVARIDLRDVLDPDSTMMEYFLQVVRGRLEICIDEDYLFIENQVLYLLPDDVITFKNQQSDTPEDPVDLWKSNFAFVLDEIITNALQGRTGSSIKSGSSKVTVHAYKKNNQVIVEISDNGEGIPPEIIESMRCFGTKSNKGEERVGGYGLVAIWEYLTRIGGVMEIRTATAEVVGPEASGTKISFMFDVDGQQTK